MIGCTVSTIGGITKGIERAVELGYDCTQVYTTKSRSWSIGNANIAAGREYAKRYGIYLISHVPLIVNLASKDETIREKSLLRLSQEIIQAYEYGIKILVLHPGSTVDGNRDRGIDCIIRAINNVYNMCEEYNIALALETMSGQGTQLGSNFEELLNIFQGAKNNSNLAVCLDTCHMYAAGYQIERTENFYNVLNEFDRKIGISKIAAIHLNNTKTERGKKIDRHSSIFEGKICVETFEALVCDKQFEHVPIVIEPPAKDTTGAEQVRYLKKIIEERRYGN